MMAEENENQKIKRPKKNFFIEKKNSVLSPSFLLSHPPHHLERPPFSLRMERAGDIPYPDSSRRGEGGCQGP